MRLASSSRRLAEGLSWKTVLKAERYKQMFEHGPVATLVLDARGTIVEANDAAVRLLAAEAVPLVGAPFGEFFRGTEKLSCAKYLDRCVKEGLPAETMLVLHTPRQPLIAYLLGTYRRGGPDEPAELIISLCDLSRFSDPVQPEEADDPLQEALVGSPVVLFHQDLGLRYTWVHGTADGSPLRHAVGKTDADLFPSRTIEQLREMKAWVLTHMVARREMVNVSLTDSGEGLTDLSIFPRFVNLRELIGIRGVALDLTRTLGLGALGPGTAGSRLAT